MKSKRRQRYLLATFGLLSAATLVLTVVNSSSGTQGIGREQDYEVTLLCSSCGHLDELAASRVRADFAAIRQAPYLPEDNSTELTSPIRKGLPCTRCAQPSNFPNPIQCERCRRYYHPLPLFSGIFDLVCPHCQYPLPRK